MSNTSEKLTAKQELFCLEYLKDLNAAQAAIRAGYSEATAKQIGHENLTKLYLQERIQALMEERASRTRVTADYVLQELKSLADDDLKNYIDFSTTKRGKLVMKWKDLSQVDTKNISELQIERNGTLKIKRYSRENALTQLGRHLGLFDSAIKTTLERILIEASSTGTLTDEHMQKIANLIVEINKNKNND